MKSTVPETFVRDVNDCIKVCLADGKLNSGELLKIAALVAEKANAIENLSYDDKKDLVLVSVQAALKQQLTQEQFEQVESKFVLQILPVVLDIAFASHGKYVKMVEDEVVEAVEAVKAGWFACLSCVSVKAVPVVPVAPVAPAVPVAPVAPAAPAVPVAHVMCSSVSNVSAVEPVAPVVESVVEPVLSVREPESL